MYVFCNRGKMEKSLNPQALKRSGVKTLFKKYLPHFSVSMLGLIPINIWIQCCIYDHYLPPYMNLVTTSALLLRVVVIAALMFLFLKVKFSPLAQTRLAYASVFAMMMGAALFLLCVAQGKPPFLFWLASLFSALGITWGGGMWIGIFIRLAPQEAFLYGFLGLGGSVLLGYFFEIVPLKTIYLIAMLMPPLALIAFEEARRVLDKRLASDTPPDTIEAALNVLAEKYYLTEREREVVRLIAHGRSKAYIGKELYLSVNTVKTYVKNIHVKLNVHSKQELLDCLEQRTRP